MEATGVVFRQPLRFPSSCGGARPDFQELAGPTRRVSSIGFRDQGHVRYYVSVAASSSSAPAAGRAKREKAVREDKAAKKLKKKQLKLLKGLFRDLTTFSHMSFGSESDFVGGSMISEASELLLKQLEKVKAEEKQLKRKMKEEKARLKAAARSQTRSVSPCSSSESSSSDSECGEIVDMNDLKKQVIEEATTLAYPVPIIPTIDAAETSCSGEERASSSCNNAENETSERSCLKKIEVCMGGKCKKSGAGALLEEFQKAIGVDGAVSGCKCMGKCRDGPNVKVSDGVDADKSVRAPGSNSLCIGVGLEDVDMIVESFFGGKGNQIGFVASC